MRGWAVLCLLLLLAACSRSSATEQTSDFVAGDGSVRIVPATEREPAPAVSGQTLDGQSLSLDDLPGPVVVNFWASWCGPCAQEAPHLAAIAEEYRPEGVHVLGVNIKDQPANARTFEAEFDLGYPSLYDEAAVVAAAFGGIGPGALPSTIVLDAQHRVAVRVFGAVNAAQLGRYLDELLREAP
jgi:thiol-disulfide isomerase/thioredoxin